MENMDRVRADRPWEAARPNSSPAAREIRPMTSVSSTSSPDTCRWLRPSSR